MRGEQAETIDPDLKIIDCHHHLWQAHHPDYLVNLYQADLDSGHDVISSVYVECGAMYRRGDPEALRSVGEAAFVAGMAAMSETGVFGSTRICEGFVGAADLGQGEAVETVLEQLDHASGGRLRGIRGTANWDPDASVNSGSRPFAPQGLLLDRSFQAGVARLGRLGLVYDAWQYFPQLGELCDLADACPEVTVVVNHCGGLLGIGRHRRADTFDRWKAQIAAIARRPNVRMKLGGLAGGRTGFGYEARQHPASPAELAANWRPYIETCIEMFGPERCMFESNFPVDRIAGSFHTVFNVYKSIVAGYSTSEKEALFGRNASEVYHLAWQGAT